MNNSKFKRKFLADGSDGNKYELFEYEIIGPIGSKDGYTQHGPIGSKYFLSTGKPVEAYMGDDFIIDGTNITLKEIK